MTEPTHLKDCIEILSVIPDPVLRQAHVVRLASTSVHPMAGTLLLSYLLDSEVHTITIWCMEPELAVFLNKVWDLDAMSEKLVLCICSPLVVRY